VIVEEIKL